MAIFPNNNRLHRFHPKLKIVCISPDEPNVGLLYVCLTLHLQDSPKSKNNMNKIGQSIDQPPQVKTGEYIVGLSWFLRF